MNARQKGLTIAELLVAVTIMMMMLLAFNQIMTESRKVVSQAQRDIRANSTAAAIIQTFRQDISRATKNGALCIADDGRNASMVVVTAGPTPSKIQQLTGTGAAASFGVCSNQARITQPGYVPDVLYYQRRVLTSTVTTVVDDLWPVDLSALVAGPPAAIYTTVTNGIPTGVQALLEPPNTPPLMNNAPVDAVSIPVTLDYVNQAWRMMSTRCNWLSIMWTNGMAGGNLNWYGVDEPNAPMGRVRPRIDASIEFVDGGFYHAMWTLHNQNNWPTAIRIRFELTEPDPTDPDGPGLRKVYEDVCAVGG